MHVIDNHLWAVAGRTISGQLEFSVAKAGMRRPMWYEGEPLWI